MKVLVTGGAGFIGSHIVDALLAAGHSAAVLDNLSSGARENLPTDVPIHVADIADAAAVERVFATEKPDAVCHQAAQMSVSLSVRDPAFDARSNVMGLIHVLSAAAAHGVKRFVFASSGGVLYGEATSPAPESTPPDPISPYGITKWVGERYLSFFAREHGFEAVALRYSNVYGPRQNPHGEAGVVAIFCKRYLAGEAATVNGDGKYVRDYVYGPDVARANLAALESASIRPGTLTSLNIGTGIGTDVNELEAALRTAMTDVLARKGKPTTLPAPSHGPARAGDLRSNLVDAALASKVLGWQPTVTLSGGLAKTAAWFAG